MENVGYQRFLVQSHSGEVYEVYVPNNSSDLLDSNKVREEVANLHISPACSLERRKEIPPTRRRERTEYHYIGNDNSYHASSECSSLGGASSTTSGDITNSSPSDDVTTSSSPDTWESESLRTDSRCSNRTGSANRNQPSSEFECSFNEMPFDIIMNIFKYLSKPTLAKCAQVCHKWKNVVAQESLWSRLDLSGRRMSVRAAQRALSKGVRLLRMAQIQLHGSARASLQPDLWRLQYLDMSMASCSVSQLHALLSGCSQLVKLSLETCEINADVCRNITQNRKLKVLNLCMTKGLTANSITDICQSCEKVEAMNLSWSRLGKPEYRALVTSCPKGMLQLNLSGGRQSIRDKDVSLLCRRARRLRELDLSDCTLLSAASVQIITEQLYDLEHLALSRCYHVPKEALLMLRSHPSLLAVESFNIVGDEEMRQLAENIKPLELNKFPLSSIARPTTGLRRTSIWGERVRDVS